MKPDIKQRFKRDQRFVIIFILLGPRRQWLNKSFFEI